jgi:2-dehydropantoate 2-reductase
VDAQLGAVVELGAKHGIAVPLVAQLVEVVHALERGERKMQSENLAELRRLDDATYR